MVYEEYRRKKWRERNKFDRRNEVDIERVVQEMRELFGHLCFECRAGWRCPHMKGGKSAILICPYFQQKAAEVSTYGRIVSRSQAGSSGKGYQSYGSDRGYDYPRHSLYTGGKIEWKQKARK